MEFTREDTPTIMDGAVVRYRCGDFEINASRNGISTNGFMPMIRQQEDLDTVCEYMRRAFRQYVALSPNRSSMRSYANPLPESVFEAVEHSVQADICPRCDGTGKYQRLGFAETDCALCNGTGKCR